MMEAIRHKTPRGHVAIVDDDALFRESVAQNLLDAGFSVTGLADGASAITFLSEAPTADVLLLDWKMPGMTGIEVLRRIRDDKIPVPVIFLTVLGDQIYEEAALLGGAVDFVEKSRSFAIILRRIELILSGLRASERDTGPEAPLQKVHCGQLELRLDSNRGFWKDRQIDLSLTEFQVVCCLARQLGEDVGYRDLYNIVHREGFVAGEGDLGYRANVRSFIKRIRQKFREVDSDFDLIENYPGFGYRWRNELGS